MSPSGFVFVLVVAALSTVANLMMRSGIDAAGGFAPGSPVEALSALVRLFVNPIFIAGFLAYVFANVAWFRTIATEPLSIAYPLLVGLTFIFLTSGAAAFLHEPVTVRKVIGLAVILGGIWLASMESGTA